MRKISTLLAVAFGAAFGMLFAPKKGSELRKELKTELEKGGDGTEVLKKTATHLGKDVQATAKEIYNEPVIK